MSDRSSTIGELSALRLETEAAIQKELDYYPTRRKLFMFATQFVRIGGFLGIVVGAMWPAFHEGDSFKVPYFAALAGGLVLLSDRVFGFSRTWVRFMQAELALKAALSELKYDFLKVMHLVGNEQDAHQRYSEVIDLLKAVRGTASKIVRDETASWQGELDQALKALSDQLDLATRSAFESKGKAEKEASDQAKSKATGTLNLAVKATKPLTNVGVNVGKLSRNDLTTPTRVSFSGLPAGANTVTATGTREGGTPARVEQTFEIKSGEIAEGTLSFD